MDRTNRGIIAVALLLGVVACSDDNSSGVTVASPESSGTLVVSNESSSSIVAGAVSSSSENVAASSSSEDANSSSSAKAPKNTAACMWKATHEYVPVNTGLDPDDEYSAGYWYFVNDYAEGGASYNDYVPCDDQLNEWECMVSIVDNCDGFCGEFILNKGSASEAYAGFAFDVAGVEDPYSTSSKVRKGDISDWGGVCVTYTADRDVYLELDADSAALYEIKLGSSTDLVEKCVTWSELNAVESSKHARRIVFKMKSAEAEDVTASLKVAAIGKYDVNGACELLASSSSTGVISSSSSASGNCEAPQTVSEMWNGFALPLTYVETGLDNGTETSGYWFSFGDEESGNGKVVYPSTPGIDYTTTDQVFDYCMGVCGSLEFSKEGYLGVGFHVAGVVDPMDDNSLVAKANISSWGGLCVTYASESDLEVVLTYAQTSGFGDFSRMPKTTLPKSIELRTVCLDWENYFMTVFSEVSVTFMTSVLFAVKGDANTKSRFNIRGLGKYSDKTNFCSLGEDEFVSSKKGLVIP